MFFLKTAQNTMSLRFAILITSLSCMTRRQKSGEHSDFLSDLPQNMKADIRKAGDCKKLNGLNCSPTCSGGYAFTMDGEEFQKCKNMAFFPSLTEENYDAIMKLIRSELGEY